MSRWIRAPSAAGKVVAAPGEWIGGPPMLDGGAAHGFKDVLAADISGLSPGGRVDGTGCREATLEASVIVLESGTDRPCNSCAAISRIQAESLASPKAFCSASMLSISKGPLLDGPMGSRLEQQSFTIRHIPAVCKTMLRLFQMLMHRLGGSGRDIRPRQSQR